ncbi:MAG: anti-sigma factor [bacterium]|nr:anti-sigma factor [bacterium]
MPILRKMLMGVMLRLGMIACSDTVAMLSGYVDGELDPKICDVIKKHLEGCTNCRVVFDSFTKTVTIYRQLPEEDVPEEIHIRLTEYLRKEIVPEE